MTRGKRTIFAMAGILLMLGGTFAYLVGGFLGGLRALHILGEGSKSFIEVIIWYSVLPIAIGALALSVDLFTTVPKKRAEKKVVHHEFPNDQITVVLTAYNDELSIGQSVKDFLSFPRVRRVIVISNNSRDNTMAVAAEAGAIVHNETTQGYGACVLRALTEAAAYDDTATVALCEGDMTFRAYDLDKLTAYLPHADIVNGTRIVEQLQEANTQLSMFMHYGNFAVAKLLEIKYLGDATLSDVGTTYKVIRTEALRLLLPQLDNKVNLEFNPYFLEKAIRTGFSVLECPITFHPRVGVSKGGNISNKVALRVGTRMIGGIILGWERLA